LKVQHKQIRRNDFQDADPDSFVGDFAGGYPPAAPSANLWFDTKQNPIDGGLVKPNPVDAAQSTYEYRKPSDAEDSEEPPISSPLDTLGQMQDSLPDITAGVGEGGENVEVEEGPPNELLQRVGQTDTSQPESK
jgi:hypothetical protein